MNFAIKGLFDFYWGDLSHKLLEQVSKELALFLALVSDLSGDDKRKSSRFTGVFNL